MLTNPRYEFHPENGDVPHVCVRDHRDDPDRGPHWIAYNTREQAEARIAKFRAEAVAAAIDASCAARKSPFTDYVLDPEAA